MENEVKIKDKKTIGVQVSLKLWGKVALFAKALDISRSSVVRNALNEYFEQLNRIADSRTRLRQRYQVAWERLKMQSYMGKSNKELSELFSAFILETRSELAGCGLVEKDINEIVKRLRI